MELNNAEKRVLMAIKEMGQDQIKVSDLLNRGFKSQVELMNALSWLRMKGVLKIEETLIIQYELTDEGRSFKLPEKELLSLIEVEKSANISTLLEKLNKKTVSLGISHLKDLGAEVEHGNVIIKDPKKIEEEIKKREEYLKSPNFENKALLAHFLKRGYFEKREKVERVVVLTNIGKNLVNEKIEIKDEVSQLTPELIQTGKWKDIELRKYDIQMFVPRIYPGKLHPITAFIQKVRTIFLEMGFEEISGDFVQSAFWNMDALYIPQDHPARDMQDTFYLKNPDTLNIPDYKDKVREIHESGGGISKGWKYGWSEEEAKKALLRTHTTVNTIKYLYDHRDKDIMKVFMIGKVFRRENMDPTHLPEFIQIEGIMTEPGASLSMLVGLFRAFYKELGFEKIKIKPSYFPYTEPSLEVHVEFKGKWFELGGAGIFRAEVTEPMNIKTPVLAWGLGLERLAMLYFGIEDLRELYISDLKKLKNLRIL